MKILTTTILIIILYFSVRFPKYIPLFFAIGFLIDNNHVIEGFYKEQEFYQYEYQPGTKVWFNGHRYGMECRNRCQEFDHACLDYCTDSCKNRCAKEHWHNYQVSNCKQQCELDVIQRTMLRRNMTCPGDYVKADPGQ